MSITPKKIAVLLGGWCSEREVSLVSGASIVEALKSLGHHVIAVDVQRDLPGLLQALLQQPMGKPDVIFNALHGRGGEDGSIQGVLEYLGIPYTHSGVLASALCMDKPIAKKLVSLHGVRCPEGAAMTRDALLKDGVPFEAPYVIKPTNEGSSVGVRIVRKGENFDVVQEGWVYGHEALIERYIPGRELTVGLMGGKALLVTEIKSAADFFDYTAKYSAGHAVHDCPANLPQEVTDEAMRMAEVAYAVLGCSGVARIDVRYDDTKPGTTGLYFLEMNNQPGFTPLSLVPEQAAAKGISFAQLCQWIIEHPVMPS
ncbi:MAG: D-alanine--D-alanine ligase [Alphaproteobacteria bacterium]|nr:D-alanine--D-alanine ligase [Alphaproteobacteria bacterium]